VKLNLAILLTLFRIAAIPAVVVLFYSEIPNARPIAAIFFGIAAITDFLDGWVARKYGQASAFGAFLDPVADKLIVAVALVLLVEVHASAILAIPALVIVGREIVVSALREWMARYSEMRSVTVSVFGKIKTFFQMLAIILLLGAGPGKSDPMMVGYTLLYIAAGLTLWSMYEYLKLAWPDLLSGMRND